MKNNKKMYCKVLSAFFKVGFIGFGGGSALIPVIEKEVVEKTKSIDNEEYTKQTIIANITPGALPVKLGALSIDKIAVPAAYAVTLPGVILTILILTMFTVIGETAIHYIEFASIGISIYIIHLLIMYIRKVQANGNQVGLKYSYITIMLIAFFVTCGKEIRDLAMIVFGEIPNFLSIPIFDISTINLMIITFFIIIYIGESKSKHRLLIASIISIIYAVLHGKLMANTESTALNYAIVFIMILLIIYSVFIKKTKKHKEKNTKLISSKQVFVNIGVFSVIPLLIVGLILFIVFLKDTNQTVHNVLEYAGNVLISSLTSFGGGEAYISVADGFFVQSNLIDSSTYYNQIVAIANALPGPILVKVASAIGYIIGVDKTGSIFLGWTIATIGMTISVAVSSIAALCVKIGFDKLQNSPRLSMINLYILPVICGMLISTSLSMTVEAMKIIHKNIGAGIEIQVLSLIAILLSLLVLLVIKIKYHFEREVIMLFVCGGLSLLMMTMLD